MRLVPWFTEHCGDLLPAEHVMITYLAIRSEDVPVGAVVRRTLSTCGSCGASCWPVRASLPPNFAIACNRCSFGLTPAELEFHLKAMAAEPRTPEEALRYLLREAGRPPTDATMDTLLTLAVDYIIDLKAELEMRRLVAEAEKGSLS